MKKFAYLFLVILLASPVFSQQWGLYVHVFGSLPDGTDITQFENNVRAAFESVDEYVYRVWAKREW